MIDLPAASLGRTWVGLGSRPGVRGRVSVRVRVRASAYGALGLGLGRASEMSTAWGETAAPRRHTRCA